MGNSVQKQRNTPKVMVDSEGSPNACLKSDNIYVQRLVRKLRLPEESLIDVFNCISRCDLDQMNTVSRRFEAVVRIADPLRPVDIVSLGYSRDSETYQVVFESTLYDEADTRRMKGTKVQLLKKVGSAIQVADFFFRSLRFCFVNVFIRIERFHIDKNFVDRLRAIKKDYRRLGEQPPRISDVTFAENVSVLDLVAAFPSVRRIFFDSSVSSHGPLLLERYEINDDFLRSLAMHGFSKVSYLPGGKLTDEGILDFAFGDYEDDGKGRELYVQRVTLSPQFLTNFVKRCRSSKCGLSLDVILDMPVHVDFDELAMRQPEVTGFMRYWKLHFTDLPNFGINYRVWADATAQLRFCWNCGFT